ncbi:transposable element Tcb2 transposase [Trichonephila clavipes]|nr:transposable element Tcb2 transposase [Trichonephila clavipes]
MHVKSFEARTSFHWCGVQVRKVGCHPLHLNVVQKDYDICKSDKKNRAIDEVSCPKAVAVCNDVMARGGWLRSKKRKILNKNSGIVSLIYFFIDLAIINSLIQWQVNRRNRSLDKQKFRIAFVRQLIDRYSSRKRKGHPARFQAKKCVALDDVRLTSVGNHMPKGMDLNPGEGMNVCKCVVPWRHGCTLQNRRPASPLVRLVEGKQRSEALALSRVFVLPQNWGGIELNHTVNFMVLKAIPNNRPFTMMNFLGLDMTRHLDAFTRGRIIGKLEEGRSVTSVAAEFGIAHSIVSRLWRQFQTTGTAIRGSIQKKQAADSGRNRYTTQETGRPISRFTVARRLHGGGLFARRPVRCVPLTPAHRRRRSLWCREHRNWRDNEWGRVLFTDENRFSLSSDSHRILIWRERGSRNHPSNIIERDRYGGRGVLVWGGIMLGSRTDLHIFDAGSVNGTRFCNEILLPYMRLFRGAMGLQFLFMDDNAPCHRTVAAKQLLESRRLAARTLPPVTIRELRLALQDEWAEMPQQLVDTLILSMGRRCETCLAVRGDHIPTKDRMFLAGHPSQGCFGLQSHFALHATFSIKLLFIPLISLLTLSLGQPQSVAYNLMNNIKGRKSSQSEFKPAKS